MWMLRFKLSAGLWRSPATAMPRGIANGSRAARRARGARAQQAADKYAKSAHEASCRKIRQPKHPAPDETASPPELPWLSRCSYYSHARMSQNFYAPGPETTTDQHDRQALPKTAHRRFARRAPRPDSQFQLLP